MANTYTQIYIHVVFSVKRRQNLIRKEFKEELHKYIAGIIRNKDQKLIAINSVSDHIHVFMGLKPNVCLSDLVREIKTSRFVNEKRWVKGRFNWQEGFGAFSYGHSQMNVVVKYIQNQERHHSKKTFQDEYIELLKKFNVDFDIKYAFD